MRRPIYTPEELAKASALNRRIDAGDVGAYAELTKLAAEAVRSGRWELIR